MVSKKIRAVAVDGNKILIGDWLQERLRPAIRTGHIVPDPVGGATIIELDSSGTPTITSLYELIPKQERLNRFGFSLAIAGNYAAVGSFYPKSDIYVFRKENGAWKNSNIIRFSDVAEKLGDFPSGFGHSVSVTADGVLLAGAPRMKHQSGAALFFDIRRDGHYEMVHSILGTESDSKLGYALAISNSVAVVGAWGTNRNKGKAYILERSADFQAWKQTAVLNPRESPSMSQFGGAVAVSDNIVLVGAHTYGDRSNEWIGSGAVYVFERSSEGGWNNTQLLSPSDIEDPRFFRTEAWFGKSLGITRFGDKISLAVGAPGWDQRGGVDSPQGKVFLFERDVGGAEGFKFVKSFSMPFSGRGFMQPEFGRFLAFSMDRLLVGITEPKHTMLVSPPVTNGNKCAHLLSSKSELLSLEELIGR